MVNFFYSSPILKQKSTVILKVNTQLLVKGPLGASFLYIPENVFFQKHKEHYRFFGLAKNKNLILTYYKLTLNKLQGVNLGFVELMTISGLGWGVSVKNQSTLQFSVGYSHLIQYTLKPGVEITLYSKHSFKLFSLNLNELQQVVTDLYKLRAFNVYKGKGIYKQNQVFKLKESSKSKA